MKYNIKVEEREEYDEVETVYEMGGTRYFSEYHEDLRYKKKGVDYFQKQHPTGKKLERTHCVYEQEFEADDITSIIKAVNNLS